MVTIGWTGIVTTIGGVFYWQAKFDTYCMLINEHNMYTIAM